MDSYLFFLSYARDDVKDDQDRLIERFFRDLERDVRFHYGPFKGKVGFFDTDDVARGDWWSPAMDQALRTCRVFVSLYSPTYFTREFCGKEWGLFQRRLLEYANSTMPGQKPPPLIQPVLLVGEEFVGEPPAAAREVNYFAGRDPRVYVEGGLKVLSLKKNVAEYEEFVLDLAQHIVQTAKAHALPERFDLPSVRDTPDAFGVCVPRPVAAAAEDDEKSFDQVDFFFIAGRRDELEAIRRKVNCYGRRGGIDWKPFEPLIDENVVITAQRIATKEKLAFSAAPLDGQLIDRLNEAWRQKRIVALIVDPWTLRLPRYAEMVRGYDTYDCVHCLMIVCRNEDDEETARHLDDIDDAVSQVFDVKVRKPPSEQFLYPFSAAEEFEDRLSQSLKKIQLDLLCRGLDRLKLERPAGEPARALPPITGPGGG